jgi:ERCC4-related helicase
MDMFAAGQRIALRGEDFIVTDVTRNYDGSLLLTTEGVSELVKGKRFVFDTSIDTNIEAVNPRNTVLSPDRNTGYRKTKLFVETQLRSAASITNKITIGHKGAIDVADYQLTPTLKALELPRPRILIADTVGLGKTVEVGIMLAELMKRGRGKRVLVLALKSILGQFQQDIWNRFAIPLVRLDSLGIARLKAKLPMNKNPFDFYDKTIISIDTLKNNAKFRHYIEKSHWDVIVIDECHTVANIKSQRGDLANYLSTKCESLILTSATPHNGRRENFANLIRMIEPTAISSEGEFTKDDIRPYYVRRFKHDIDDEAVLSNFQTREIIRLETALHPEEENFLHDLQQRRFRVLSNNNRDDWLFAIGMFKAYMSSPEAAAESLRHRRDKLLKQDDEQAAGEVSGLLKQLERIMEQQRDAKYRRFREALIGMEWAGRKKDERVVVFAERINTLSYLYERLVHDFDLQEQAIATFSGSLSDVDQEAMIEDFGKEDSRVRILLCSDAGSQGVNLHHQCHRMVNYDIPWSLITLEQRNGRIDRYGQKKTPYIYYLLAGSGREGIQTDMAIIDRLIEKEKVVHETLGDAGAVMNIYDAEEEEKKVEQAMLDQNVNFLEQIEAEAEDFDFGALGFDESTEAVEQQDAEPLIQPPVSLYRSDDDYYHELFLHLLSSGQLDARQVELADKDKSYVEFLHDDRTTEILYDLPEEALPAKNGYFRLTTDKALVQRGIEEARKKSGEWAGFQMMYDLHPLMRYLLTKMDASVDKGVAPVAHLSQQLPAGSSWFVIQGQVSNDLGQPVYNEFFVVGLDEDGAVREEPLPLHSFCEQFGITEQLYTRTITDAHLQDLQEKLELAVDLAETTYMPKKQHELELQMEQKLSNYKKQLEEWKQDSMKQLEIDFEGAQGFQERKRKEKAGRIERINDTTSRFFKDYTSLGNDAFLKIIAVFYNRTDV